MKGALVLIGILMISMLFMAGCKSEKEIDIVCSSPYIRHGLACCLDTNENNICDRDEGIEIKVEEPEEEEVEEEEEETEAVEIPEITAKIEGFEDFDIVLSDDVEEDVVEMAIELAKLINYDSDIVTKSQFDISGYDRIYLIKKKNTTISELNEFIIAVGDDAPNSIVSKADDLADGIGYVGGIKALDEIDFTEYKRAIYLVTES